MDRLKILHMAGEPGLQRLVEQVAGAFAAPIALLNVIRDDRLWMRASIGLDGGCLPRRDSFCHHALDRDELLEVCDARAHPVFAVLPAVTGEPFLRYYIGAPLTVAGGVDVGVLCIADPQPRPPASEDQKAYLRGLARHAAGLLDRHAHRRDLAA